LTRCATAPWQLNWKNSAFSPDGARIALDHESGTEILDLERGTLLNLPEGPSGGLPAWSPDGDYIIFTARDGEGPTNLYLARADGGGAIHRLTDSERYQWSQSWHPSGRWLAFAESSPDSSWDVRMLELESDPTAGWRVVNESTLVSGPDSDFWTAFSPDGSYVAYSSQETGRREIYVRAFPGPGPVSRVSVNGGAWPVWSRAKNELLFGSLDGRVMNVSYEVRGGEFVPSPPSPWTDKRFLAGLPDQYFDLHPDGERLMIRLAVGETNPSNAVLVSDVSARIRDRVAESR